MRHQVLLEDAIKLRQAYEKLRDEYNKLELRIAELKAEATAVLAEIRALPSEPTTAVEFDELPDKHARRVHDRP